MADPRLRELVQKVVRFRGLARRLKATRDPDAIPTPQALLKAALAHAGFGSNDGLTPAERLKLLHSLRLVAKAWLRREAERALAEIEPEAKSLGDKAKSTLGRFFRKAAQVVKNLVVASALTIFGPGPPTLGEVEGIRQAQAEQLEYLDHFRIAVESGEQPLDGTFVSRAEQYGALVWPAAHKIVRGVVQSKKIFVEEKRVHLGPRTPTDPCPECIEQEDQGWQPIGTLLSIGSTLCRSSCHCVFVYRTEDGTEWMAGRGPLDEFAFGRTG